MNPDTLLSLLCDALVALENIGSEPELCERIREAIREDVPPDTVQRGIVDDLPW